MPKKFRSAYFGEINCEMYDEDQMSSSVNSQRISRPLYAWEISQAALVFGDNLHFEKVRIHEFAVWPDLVDNIGRKLKKISPRKPDEHNAITLGYGCYFPVGFPLEQTGPKDLEFYKMVWLIHELTHCWQFQRMGIRYLFVALKAQFGLGANVYDFCGPTNLVAKRQQGWKIFNFNLEQQGRIAENYFKAQCDLPKQQEIYDACLPYVKDINGQE